MRLVRVFGAQAVYGNLPLSVATMRRLLAAESTRRLYNEREEAEDRVMWEFDHPGFAALIEAVEDADA